MEKNVLQSLREIINELKYLDRAVEEVAPSSISNLYSYCTQGLETVLENISQEIQEERVSTEENCINYDNFVFEEGEHIVLNQYVGFDDEEIVIPDYYNGKPVFEIADNAFAKCKHIRKVKLGRFVSIIGATAFMECENLTEVTNGCSVVYIGDGCFSNCSRFDTFEWNDNLKFVGSAAFAKTKFKKIITPKGLRYIAGNMFSGCTELEEVVLHDDVIRISNNAFSKCKKLKKINFPVSLKHIEDKAFMDCVSLFEVEIYTTDAIWGESVFSKEIYHRPDLRYNPWYTYSPLDSICVKCYPNSTIQNYCRLHTIKCMRLEGSKPCCKPQVNSIIGVKVEKSRYFEKTNYNQEILALLNKYNVKFIHRQETRLIGVRDAYYFLEPLNGMLVAELKRMEKQSFEVKCFDLTGKYFY